LCGNGEWKWHSLRYQNRWYQLTGPSRPRASAQDRVLVCEGRHGNIAIENRGPALRWQEIPAPRKPIEVESQPAGKLATERKTPRMQGNWVPPGNQPWREAARRGEQQRARKLAAMAAQASSAWPPPLRPKRSALRAPQGCAPCQAQDKDKEAKRKAKRGHF
jgi:hypothetical protein